MAVADGEGRVRRFTKLEATVRQIVDGAAAGDARSIKLLFALFKTDERALAEPETRAAGAQDAADALVVAEIVRRFGGGGQPKAGDARLSGRHRERPPDPVRGEAIQGPQGGGPFLDRRVAADAAPRDDEGGAARDDDGGGASR